MMEPEEILAEEPKESPVKGGSGSEQAAAVPAVNAA